MIVFYMTMMTATSLVCGVTIAIWLAFYEREYIQRASITGGLVGAMLGTIWPVVLAGVVTGLVAYGVLNYMYEMQEKADGRAVPDERGVEPDRRDSEALGGVSDGQGI